MRIRLAVLAFASILVLPALSRAQATPSPTQPAQPVRIQVDLRESASVPGPRAGDPYRALFQFGARRRSAASDRAAAEVPTPPTRHAVPTVVCGMTLIPIDPNFDPKSRSVVPETGTRYTYRPFTNSVCRAK